MHREGRARSPRPKLHARSLWKVDGGKRWSMTCYSRGNVRGGEWKEQTCWRGRKVYWEEGETLGSTGQKNLFHELRLGD